MPLSCAYVFSEDSILVHIPEELTPLITFQEATSHRVNGLKEASVHHAKDTASHARWRKVVANERIGNFSPGRSPESSGGNSGNLSTVANERKSEAAAVVPALPSVGEGEIELCLMDTDAVQSDGEHDDTEAAPGDASMMV